MLEIMTASAGAGKTYHLVLRYITILLTRRENDTYKHILAVTFTNKATDEMKSRILRELHILATKPLSSQYYNEFVPSSFASADLLQKKAETVLHNILHDYSAFSVSTIDKFFQQTLKAFAKEIGQFASYQVELDKDSLVEESVDRILDSLTEEDKTLLSWLTDNVLEQIEKGERYSMDSNLKDMALRLKSTQRQEALKSAGIDEEKAYTTDNLKAVRKHCRMIISDFEKRVRQAAVLALDALRAAGVDPQESNRKFMTGLYTFAELEDNQKVPMPTDAFLRNSSNPDLWFAKSKADKLLPIVEPLLSAPLEAFCSLFGKEYQVYNTALILDGQIYGLGIAGELHSAFNEIMKEKNVLCIDDSNTILRDIIDGSDAPFVYEKTGVWYEHFLLDEFQDTSEVQWDNFLPLLTESESKAGSSNLIVGDVKQSIYRWRGSNWKLLQNTVPEKFPSAIHKPLDTNWRSLGNVVEFNNGFFSMASELLDKVAPSQEGTLAEIYAGVSQKVAPKNERGGSVSLTFCDKSMEIDAVLKAIEEVVEAGASYSDIAILVRSNSTGGDIANALTDKGIPVITDDSLRVKGALTVRRIVSLMAYVDNPQDTIRSFLARSLDVDLPAGWTNLVDLAENIFRSLCKSDDQQQIKGETLHIQSFFDYLQDYVSSEGNNLRGFLHQFDADDPAIASPSSGDSVRVMTVHKSKGLDFNYVIIPFVENVTFYKSSNYWSVPQLGDTPLEGVAEGVYDVCLSKSSETTLFADSYRKEAFLQLVDNMNIIYVAMTRAVLGMHVIAKTLPKTAMTAIAQEDASGLKDFSQMLWWYASSRKDVNHIQEEIERFDFGKMVDFREFHSDKPATDVFPISTFGSLPSFPLNPSVQAVEADNTDVRERGRLKFSADSVDFFSPQGDAGISASNRIRGVVLHDILSQVSVPSDLQKAVNQALSNGEITVSEAPEILSLLSERVAEGLQRGWFPSEGARILNETSIVDTDGQVYRPDRVVDYGDKVIIIDYKAGEHQKKYERQIGCYARIWRDMGYSDVSACLWYLGTGTVIQLDGGLI